MHTVGLTAIKHSGFNDINGIIPLMTAQLRLHVSPPSSQTDDGGEQTLARCLPFRKESFLSFRFICCPVYEAGIAEETEPTG